MSRTDSRDEAHPALYSDLTVRSVDEFQGVGNQGTQLVERAIAQLEGGLFDHASVQTSAAPAATSRYQRVGDDRQVFRPLQEQCAEWVAFQPHLWVRGRQQVEPGQDHLDSHPPAPSAKAVPQPRRAAKGAADLELEVCGRSAVVHNMVAPADDAADQRGVAEEVLAAHGSMDDTFAVQYDSWVPSARQAVPHGVPGVADDGADTRDGRALAVGLPPMSPHRTLAWQLEEAALDVLWQRLVPILAPAVHKVLVARAKAAAAQQAGQQEGQQEVAGGTSRGSSRHSSPGVLMGSEAMSWRDEEELARASLPPAVDYSNSLLAAAAALQNRPAEPAHEDEAAAEEAPYGQQQFDGGGTLGRGGRPGVLHNAAQLAKLRADMRQRTRHQHEALGQGYLGPQGYLHFDQTAGRPRRTSDTDFSKMLSTHAVTAASLPLPRTGGSPPVSSSALPGSRPASLDHCIGRTASIDSVFDRPPLTKSTSVTDVGPSGAGGGGAGNSNGSTFSLFMTARGSHKGAGAAADAVRQQQQQQQQQHLGSSAAGMMGLSDTAHRPPLHTPTAAAAAALATHAASSSASHHYHHPATSAAGHGGHHTAQPGPHALVHVRQPTFAMPQAHLAAAVDAGRSKPSHQLQPQASHQLSQQSHPQSQQLSHLGQLGAVAGRMLQASGGAVARAVAATGKPHSAPMTPTTQQGGSCIGNAGGPNPRTVSSVVSPPPIHKPLPQQPLQPLTASLRRGLALTDAKTQPVLKLPLVQAMSFGKRSC